jgi:hypothetical protein
MGLQGLLHDCFFHEETEEAMLYNYAGLIGCLSPAVWGDLASGHTSAAVAFQAKRESSAPEMRRQEAEVGFALPPERKEAWQAQR